MKSLYKRELTMMVGIVALSFTLLSTAFMLLSYRYIISETRDRLERNAGYIAAATSDYLQNVDSLSLLDGIKWTLYQSTMETVTAQEQFDIIEVMSRVLVSLEGRITGRGLDVDAQFPEDPIMVWGDPDAVTQVCYNLLDNAAKFAAQGTDITVQITKKDGKALVTVRNLGATIPPDELPLLFERFHKADYSRSVDREGVGLGLYIVKTILGNLKENITATSEDGVTQFTFTLTLA